jgi:hypothetical protein
VYVGPGGGLGDARHQGVDVAVEAVELRHLGADPLSRQPLVRSRDMQKALREKPRVGVAHHLAEVGDLADLPQQADCAGARSERHHVGVARQQLQRPMVVCVAHLHEAVRGRPFIECAQ